MAERINQTSIKFVRFLHHHKRIGEEFLVEATNIAIFVSIRVTTRGHGPRSTLFELIFLWKTNLSFPWVFECRCWNHLDKQKVSKLDVMARKAILTAYARGIRGHKHWDVTEQKDKVSRDVNFEEIDFDPFTTIGSDRKAQPETTETMNSGKRESEALICSSLTSEQTSELRPAVSYASQRSVEPGFLNLVVAHRRRGPMDSGG